MWRHLNQLNGLRCFEAAARHQSFKLAADELCVTQAAVSHQIRALESAFNVTLFERRPRQVQLTFAGGRLSAVLSATFDQINRALADLSQDNATLRLAVSQTFSAGWLQSRLPRFLDAYPEIQLHIEHWQPRRDETWSQYRSRYEPISLEGADIAVIWTLRQPERLWAHRLFSFSLSPVCAPSLIRDAHPLHSPADLRHYRLLHDDTFKDWERWLAHAGVPEIDALRGLVMDNTAALLLAAAAGSGVALAPLPFIEEDLASGRLVRPFDECIEAAGAYWLVASPATAEHSHFRALAEFLIAESPALLARGHGDE